MIAGIILLITPVVMMVSYYLTCAYCDQTLNRDGSRGSWPFKNRM